MLKPIDLHEYSCYNIVTNNQTNESEDNKMNKNRAKRIEILREKRKIREELSKKGIFTFWDPNQPKLIILYKPWKPGVGLEVLGHITENNETVFYETSKFF